MTIRPIALAAAALLALTGPDALADRGPAWARHVIDDGSRGADGVRLADADGDGDPDIATGWEEGGLIRLCLNPGPGRAKERWPTVTVGRVGSPEDAVLVDLDGDGAPDVLSASEGETRSLHVHWAPRDRGRLLDPNAWMTRAVPVARDARMWMFSLPVPRPDRPGFDLLVGSKGEGGALGWLMPAGDARDLAAWRWVPIVEAGWIMGLVPVDLDGDGDLDVAASDRKGPRRGCFWLENPGTGAAADWPRHPIGGEAHEVMFLTASDLDRDGRSDLVAATRDAGLILFRPDTNPRRPWRATAIDLPARTGTPKAVAVGDVDRDGRPDLVFTCEAATEGRSGVVRLSYRDAPTDRVWADHEVSGPDGVKFDLVELLDLDGDGDLDALTCEERDNLGVIWYENPSIP